MKPYTETVDTRDCSSHNKSEVMGHLLRFLQISPALRALWLMWLCSVCPTGVAALEGGTPGGAGDGSRLTGVHPSFDLMNLRPPGFDYKIGGVAFMPDGRLVVSTWNEVLGVNDSVWILDNVDQDDPSLITATQIASGLAEPLGILVHEGVIYVSEKTQVTRLVDLDGDDIIDLYEPFATGFPVTSNYHNFSFGLVAKEGYMWLSLSTCVQGFGFACDADDPENTANRGSLLRIVLDPVHGAPGDWEIVATGLRTPNGLGIGADGELFGTDNQGNWLPANKIIHFRTDESDPKFHANFGHINTIPSRYQYLPPTPPAIYLDHDTIGSSPSQPVLVPPGNDYVGQMMHGDVRHGGVKRDFLEWVDGAYQGAAFRFTQGLEAGINRMVWHQGDLYVGGVGEYGNWSEPGKLYHGLQRLRPNGRTTFEMLRMESRSTGFEIELTAPLDYYSALDSSSYEVVQWHYEPTAAYGGPRIDEETLEVTSVSISQDSRQVFLEVPGIEAGKVVYLRLRNLPSANGTYPWSTEAFYTLNAIADVVGPTFIEATAPPPNRPRPADDPADVIQGISFARYLGAFNTLPDFDALVPTAVGALENFDISASVGEDHFGYRFEGYVAIDTEELVTFYTNSDDGSRLWIGNTLVVENNGLHGPIEASGSLLLAPGLHAIRVEYFESGYGEVLEVLYESSLMPKQAISGAVLFRGVPTTAIEPYAQAEDGARLGGACVASSLPGFSGSGYVSCLGAPGASLRLTVDVPETDLYDLTLRYARDEMAFPAPASIDLSVSGGPAQLLALPAASTDTWSRVTLTVHLAQGVNVMELANTSGPSDAIELDRIELVRHFESGFVAPPSIVCAPSTYGSDCRQDAAPYLAFPSTPPVGDFSLVPPLLSQTGAFSSVSTLSPSPQLLAYQPIAELWSDGARKIRWVSLPTGTAIEWSPTGNWVYPDGSVLVKHFELPIDEVNPMLTRRLETRFMIKTAAGWYGVTYRWRSDYSDADLLTAGLDETFAVDLVSGGTRTQTWTYPSPADCITCHAPATGGALGTKTGQLNAHFDYGLDKVDSQLRTWNHLGFFNPALNEDLLDTYPRFARLDDDTALAADRVRAYWDANCSQCHRSDSLIPAAWDARYQTPLSAKGVIGAAPVTPGAAGYLIDPGNPANSDIVLRSGTRGPAQMPPLGSHWVDETYLSVLHEWVQSLGAGQPGGLSAEYFADPHLQQRVLARTDTAIDFDWGSSTPDPIVTSTNYSVIWSGTVTPDFTELYTLYATVAGTMVVWIDGELVLLRWADEPVTEVTGSVPLRAGVQHSILVAYLPGSQQGRARLEWSSPSVQREVVPGRSLGEVGSGLKAEYFSDPNLGNRVLERVDSKVQFQWGGGSPDPTVPFDDFSVRWSGVLEPRYSEATTFYLKSDNGRRLWVDDMLLIDAWTNDYDVEYAATINLSSGQKVPIVVEYFESDGGASATLEWESSSLPREVVPQNRLETGVYAGLWHAELLGSINTTDPNPKTAVTVNLAESEDGIGAKTTEVFTGAIYDPDGNISFSEDIDDYARLWIDGRLVLSSDQWDDRTATGNLALAPGWHDIELRIGNLLYGSGPTTFPGFGYDPDGGENWTHLADPGNGALLRRTPATRAVSRLMALHSKMCLDVYFQSPLSGYPAHQWACQDAASQLWGLERRASGFYRLRALHSGQCLEVRYQSLTAGELVVQATCSASEAQQWEKIERGGGVFELSARHSGLCLEVAGAGLEDGTLITQWDCGGAPNQLWMQIDPDPQTPNMGKPAPAGAINLFNGAHTLSWSATGSAWQVQEGELRVGDGDLVSKEYYRDFFAHVEWWVPDNHGEAGEQEDGNSGIYLQDRYELQILNSFEKPLDGTDDAGALYWTADAQANAARPPGHWQLYEITFRAARFDAFGGKIENARVTVDWNGVRVHSDLHLPDVTPGASLPENSSPGPLRLQDHPNHNEKPRFRNIWIMPLNL
ncbi:MAG: PA14 domain-containing protein [Halioglobus sp.]|nr:PA14 domain-containing protein [Halioglobus sp.]